MYYDDILQNIGPYEYSDIQICTIWKRTLPFT